MDGCSGDNFESIIWQMFISSPHEILHCLINHNIGSTVIATECDITKVDEARVAHGRSTFTPVDSKELPLYIHLSIFTRVLIFYLNVKFRLAKQITWRARHSEVTKIFCVCRVDGIFVLQAHFSELHWIGGSID